MPDNYNLILDTLFNKSDADFLDVVFKVLKDNIEVYPENLRDDLNYFINQFSTLYKTADSVSALNEKIIEELDLKNLTINSVDNLPPFEHPIYIDVTYFGLCSLLFSEAFIENKISNNLLEKILNSEYLKCITILLKSESYYNGTITEEDINMLLDDNYKIILFITELLLTDNELDKSDHRLNKGKDDNYYVWYYHMELVIKLIKSEKKLGLCYELEQAMDLYPVITPEPIRIPLGNADDIFNLEIEPESFVLKYHWTGNTFNLDARRKTYLRDWLHQPNGINELTQKLQTGRKRIKEKTNQ